MKHDEYREQCLLEFCLCQIGHTFSYLDVYDCRLSEPGPNFVRRTNYLHPFALWLSYLVPHLSSFLIVKFAMSHKNFVHVVHRPCLHHTAD